MKALVVVALLCFSISLKAQENPTLYTIAYSKEKLNNKPHLKFVEYSNAAYLTMQSPGGDEITLKLKSLGGGFNMGISETSYVPLDKGKPVNKIKITVTQGDNMGKPINELFFSVTQNGKEEHKTYHLYNPK